MRESISVAHNLIDDVLIIQFMDGNLTMEMKRLSMLYSRIDFQQKNVTRSKIPILVHCRYGTVD